MDSGEQKYKEALSRIEKARKETSKKVLSTHVLLKDAVDKFNGKIDASVDWKDLVEFPLNTWIEIFDGVIAKKVFQSDNKMRFITKMKPNSAFLWHYHKDCKETVKVLLGELYEAVTSTTYVEGETLYYPAGFKHTPTNTGDVENELEVTFEKIE